MRPRGAHLLFILIAAAALALLCAGAFAAAAGAAGAGADEATQSGASAGMAESTPEAAAPASTDQGQLIDTFMAGSEQGQGLAVATSIDGAQGTSRYYGSYDAAGEKPVDDSTTFEWGRVSDLIVWTCVMQLVEQGEIGLDDSVAQLLPEGVELPDGYAALDMLDLMNHTAGLDVALNAARSALPDASTSVAGAFSLFSVEAFVDPGDIVAYTPYDALLAAAVVEQASGMDFVDYARTNVFDRLGMDDTYLMVGGSPTRMVTQGNAPATALSLAQGTAGPQGSSSPRASTSSVLTCFGTVSDLLKLANGVMCADGMPSAFDDPATADELFTVTRTYPSLGVARIAHGLFAFPFSSGVYGLSATTTSGFSASVYMDRTTGLAVAIMVNQAGRSDLTQGIPRVLVGRSDAMVANAVSPANALWSATYQDASGPQHGPAKLLTALERVTVAVNDQGTLVFDGLTATSLGAGVYSVDSAIDQDVYRFHISLERGSEFSRVASDSYAVPWSTLAIEGAILGAFGFAWVASLLYSLVGLVAWVRSRFVRRLRARLQPAVLFLSLATFAAGTLGIVGALRLVEGLAPAALGALVVGEGVYVAAAALSAVWLVVTRRRGAGAWSRRNVAACLLVGVSAAATVLNLVYWELLP